MGKKRTKHPKLPNGFGSIRYLGDKRKKPYQALAPAEYNKYEKSERHSLGTAEDWYESYEMLKNYHDDPYDLDLKNITYEQICETLKEKWSSMIGKPGMSKSNYDNLCNAYMNSKVLYNKKMIELRIKRFSKCH